MRMRVHDETSSLAKQSSPLDQPTFFYFRQVTLAKIDLETIEGRRGQIWLTQKDRYAKPYLAPRQ